MRYGCVWKWGLYDQTCQLFHRQHDFGSQWSLICWGALFTDKANRTLDEAMVFSMGNPPPVLRFSPGTWRRAFIAFRIPPRFGKRRRLNCWALIWSGSCWKGVVKGVVAFAEKQTFLGFNLNYPEHIDWLKMHDYFEFILRGSVLWVSAGIRPAPTIISIYPGHAHGKIRGCMWPSIGNRTRPTQNVSLDGYHSPLLISTAVALRGKANDQSPIPMAWDGLCHPSMAIIGDPPSTKQPRQWLKVNWAPCWRLMVCG